MHAPIRSRFSSRGRATSGLRFGPAVLFMLHLLLIGSAAHAIEVTFRLRPDTEAVSVSVAGYFNEWSVSASPLRDADGDGLWEATFDLAPGRHPYKFVVDGSVWVTDASAPEFEDDGFGGMNSVLVVEDLALTVEGVPAAPELGQEGEVVARDTAVRFRFRPEREPKGVSVAGTFNDWSTSASPMSDADGDGVYETVFRLARGRYLYKFVVDGTEWITDETATAFEDDGFGGQNSVLDVGSEPLVAGTPIDGEDSAVSVGPVVTFRYESLGKPVNAISVAGSFNDWNAAAHPMSDVDGDGVWEIRFRLAPGTHSYQFVIDGDEWVPDPHSEAGDDDGFGGRRSKFMLERDDRIIGTPR